MFKTLNVLKFVSSTDWGGESMVLLNLYRSLIRSKLDYGCIVYWSARPSYINLLDTVHHHSSRITTLIWSVQYVSSWEFVCWSKQAFPWKQTCQTWYAGLIYCLPPFTMSVLLGEATGLSGENHRPAASHWKTWSHNVVHLVLSEIRTQNISGYRNILHR
jgi:hypothetical protein